MFCRHFIYQNGCMREMLNSHFPPSSFPRVRKQIVNVPSFVVRLDSQKHIDFALTSPFGGGRQGRVKRKNIRKAESKGAESEEEDED